jgi:hydroxymethylpyrimidine pyrophosphatase-like HAD family hydrolase
MNQPPPISKAAALKYQGGSRGAPRLAAKGQGWLAEQIKTLARTHNVPLYQDPDLIQVMRAGVDKSAALKVVADHYGIEMKDVLAIGDNHNDMEMIRAAGVGVAMAGSPETVIEAARWVAPTNDDDGVLAAIRKFVG